MLFGVGLLLAAQGVLLAQRGGRGAAPAAPAADVPPTPRWPDGHPNLGATPNSKGYWEARPGLSPNPRAADLPLQPWARALYQYRASKADLYPPQINCKPGGGPSFFLAPGFEFV